MSTDTYLDFSPRKDFLENRSCNYIGDVGLLCGLTYNLWSALDTLCKASRGIVAPWVGDAAEALLEVCLESLDDLKAMSKENFLMDFGREKPPDWSDIPKPGDLARLFEDNIGMFWKVRVD